MNREIVAKLKCPFPINDGLVNVTQALEQIYGPCFVGGNNLEMFEDGWLCIWRDVNEPKAQPPTIVQQTLTAYATDTSKPS